MVFFYQNVMIETEIKKTLLLFRLYSRTAVDDKKNHPDESLKTATKLLKTISILVFDNR